MPGSTDNGRPYCERNIGQTASLHCQAQILEGWTIWSSLHCHTPTCLVKRILGMTPLELFYRKIHFYNQREDVQLSKLHTLLAMTDKLQLEIHLQILLDDLIGLTPVETFPSELNF